MVKKNRLLRRQYRLNCCNIFVGSKVLISPVKAFKQVSAVSTF